MIRPIIGLTDVSVHYKRGMPWNSQSIVAVTRATMAIAESETLGLVGESGSGKSTIGKICLGLLKPTTGSAMLLGEPILGIGRRKPGTLAAVLQHPEWSLNPKLTIGRSIAEPLRVARTTAADERLKVAAMLERVGLNEAFARRLPGELSGGQRQRASIARALITAPRFVVFDEAVSALDVSIQAQILNMVKELQVEMKFASLFISHDLAAVRYVAHNIIVMNSGEIVDRAAAKSFYAPMANPYVRKLQQASGLVA